MTKSPRIVALAATLLLSSAAFAATGDFSKIVEKGPWATFAVVIAMGLALD